MVRHHAAAGTAAIAEQEVLPKCRKGAGKVAYDPEELEEAQDDVTPMGSEYSAHLEDLEGLPVLATGGVTATTTGGSAPAPEPLENSSSCPRPARLRMSSFGDDRDLAAELPPNWTLRKFQAEAKSAVDEFCLSRAVEDTAGRLRELLAACPAEADELGVIALRSAIDQAPPCQQAIVDLMREVQCSSSALDGPALVRSFEKLLCTWEDITVDSPKAPENLLNLLRGCIDKELVGNSLLTKVPENLLNAGLTKAGPAIAEMLEGVAAELKYFKREISKSLTEYFVALNVAEVQTSLRELGMQAYHHEFVKKVITMAFSQAETEASREAAVSLLSQLTTAALLSKDDLQWGVTRLLGQLDDLQLDCPRSAELAVGVLSSMVADELVSVPFLRRCRMLRIGGASGVRVLDAAQRRTPEYSKKHMGTTRFKQELQNMILEYFNSGDEAEFGRCVSELAPLAPSHSSELVRKVMVLAMERTGTECEQALKLLVWLCRHEELDNDAVEAGFDEMYARMEDIKLDVPDCYEMARSFVVEAKKAELLRQDWQEPPSPMAIAAAAATGGGFRAGGGYGGNAPPAAAAPAAAAARATVAAS